MHTHRRTPPNETLALSAATEQPAAERTRDGTTRQLTHTRPAHLVAQPARTLAAALNSAANAEEFSPSSSAIDTALQLSPAEAAAADADGTHAAAEQHTHSAAQTLRDWARAAVESTDLDVRFAVLEMIQQVEHTDTAGPSLSAPGPGWTTPTGVAGTTAMRRATEKHFPLLRQDVIDGSTDLAWRTTSATVLAASSRTAITDSCEHYRRDRVRVTGMQRRDGVYSANQQRLLEVTDRTSYFATIDDRRRQVVESLASKYLNNRVSVVRLWIAHCVQGYGTTPWRTHWPAGDTEDDMMATFVTMLSLRYTTFGSVSRGVTHVRDFHRAYLNVCPPEMPQTAWLLTKIRPALAKENPLGRRIRPGLGRVQVSAILRHLWAVIESMPPSPQQKLYVNIGGLISMAYERAYRVGELARGTEFDPEFHLHRQDMQPLLSPARSSAGHRIAAMRAPARKTSASSPAAAEINSRPVIFDCDSTAPYAFHTWAKRIEALDQSPTAEHDRTTTPMFRDGNGESLTYSVVLTTLKRLAADALEDADQWNLGCHSLRIGRHNDWRGAGATATLLCNLMVHTTTTTNSLYNRNDVNEMIDLDRRTESYTAEPVEKLFRVDKHGSTEYFTSATEQPATADSLAGYVDVTDRDDVDEAEQPQPEPESAGPPGVSHWLDTQTAAIAPIAAAANPEPNNSESRSSAEPASVTCDHEDGPDQKRRKQQTDPAPTTFKWPAPRTDTATMIRRRWRTMVLARALAAGRAPTNLTRYVTPQCIDRQLLATGPELTRRALVLHEHPAGHLHDLEAATQVAAALKVASSTTTDAFSKAALSCLAVLPSEFQPHEQQLLPCFLRARNGSGVSG